MRMFDGEFRRRLLSLLETDDEVRARIQALAIGASEQDAKVEKHAKEEKRGKEQKESKDGKALKHWQEQYERAAAVAQAWKEKYDACAEDLAEAQRQAEVAQQEAVERRSERDAARQRITVIQRECDNARQEAADAQRACEAARQKTADAERARADAQETAATLEAQVRSLKHDRDQRFQQGWTLYQQYDRVSPYIRSLLEGAIPRRGFEAFIVGLAQDRSLGRIWDAVREAMLKSGDAEEVAILWDLFQYSLSLVNQGKAEDLYAIEDVSPGDAYDLERHTPIGDSRAQGNLTEVFLPGYRNLYNGALERKSLVKI